ncbi:MAG: UDP-N-acetylglucosamine 2-epimerase (non-hydrolyzing) [Patescibacteria group bacterium]|nr:UDP-N-acetylglucosamine 2-epimerase (non-hydrolyzing) [Patescibacteria group bacterium]
MKILTIIGARPQFIKAATVSRAIAKHNEITRNDSSKIEEIIIHTGQHYDRNMSDVFFTDMEIPKPNYYLDVHGLSHGAMTGQMLEKVEEVLLKEKLDIVMVYGDTNTTLAGALAAAKLHFPVAHIEAGLRSFNRRMPEEINRVLTDHASDILFCPTQQSVDNLNDEGISDNVHLVGDVMYDSILYFSQMASKKTDFWGEIGQSSKSYALATVHRAGNTDNHDKLKSICYALEKISQDLLPVIIPMHPRTKKKIELMKISLNGLKLIDPISYLDMLLLEKNAKVILTDSGGVQKEAYWFKVPCVTLRNETEWVETVEAGWNVLASCDSSKIINAVEHIQTGKKHPHLYGNGKAAEQIIQLLHSQQIF